MCAVGLPVVVTVKVPAEPAVKVAVLALVIAGAWLTVRVKDWVASGCAPVAALSVSGWGPPVRGSGVPDSVAVPSRLSAKVTPAGKVPVSLKIGRASRREGAENAAAAPAVKVAELALVIAGAWLTVRVKDWVASGWTPLAALTVSG